MEEKKVFESTELLTKAFIKVHEEIYTKRGNLADDSKAYDIASTINLALGSMSEFGSMYDDRIVYLTNIIREAFKGNHSEKEIIRLCDHLLKLTISANRYNSNYFDIFNQIEEVIIAYGG